MIDHPLALFVFCLANLSAALAFLLAAFFIVPRRPDLTRTTRASLSAGFVFAALAHVWLLLGVLFDSGATASELAVSWPALIIHSGLALCFVVGFGRLFLRIGPWAEIWNKNSVPD